ncbi:MAG: peptidoglycan DD-metalloendopeptidase family protein [Proteobacteria bacterium]|nr:peptidoglycan DD-metalloendopeptidase family protein [Pseudomonadota bacterium]
MKSCLLFVCSLLSVHVFATDIVKIHAPVAESFTCTEHWDGQFKYKGDALGVDCVVQEFYHSGERMFMRPFKNKGHENEDWFGFGKNVLAPCDCTIESIHINDITNKPGIMTPGRASSVTFKMSDGTKILIAHVANVTVSVGELVKAGSVVATVGNNGYSRNPHLHIGAWNEKQPLQIRFDQKTIGLKSRNKNVK